MTEWNDDTDYVKEQVKHALLSVKRKGMIELVDFLENKTDYFTAPASTKFHMSLPSGLLHHHFHIWNAFIEKKKLFKLNVSDDTVIITSLLHDLCKCGMYLKTHNGYDFNPEMKDKGHGKFSVQRAKKFIALTPQEETLITHHMNCFGIDYGDYTYQELHDAIKEEPLVQVFASTDMEVTLWEDRITEMKKTSPQQIIKYVEETDGGDGVDIGAIEEKFGTVEKQLQGMIRDGDVFENKPGRLKVLK